MGAEIRASWTRMLVDAYKRTLPQPVFEKAMGRIAPTTLARLDAAGPFEWLPAELHLEIVEAPFPLMTREAFRDVWRRHVLDSFEKPIFRSLVEGALRIFQKTPIALMKVAPTGWGLVSRNAGELIVREGEGPNEGQVLLTRIPETFRASEAWITCWAATLDAFMVLAGQRGEIAIDRASAQRGDVTYTLRWS